MANKDKKNTFSSTPILDQVNDPNDLKFLEIDNLEQLSSEIRSDMIDSVSKTGGHLGAGLGVVELAVQQPFHKDLSLLLMQNRFQIFA